MSNSFSKRHIGPSENDTHAILKTLGYNSLEQFMNTVVPDSVRSKSKFLVERFAQAASEQQALKRIKGLASKNEVRRSYIGMGYYGTITPPVIQRNVLENPGWYTQYTPYQPEISQGRLEALLNFQTMIIELTGLPIASASLLDEATAAAEAMNLCFNAVNKEGGARKKILVDVDAHPQNIEVIGTRAAPLEISVEVGKPSSWKIDDQVFAVFLQYPGSSGAVSDPSEIINAAHAKGALAIVSADPLSLLLLKSPGELQADVAVGSTQRFGIPFGYGGPHAAYMATKDEFKRSIPGRIVGVSKDSQGKPALRLALQTREQHIRREKATSNICTAQVLLAVMAGMYATYHGPEGLREIAKKVNRYAGALATELKKAGCSVETQSCFDTITVKTSPDKRADFIRRADAKLINLRVIGNDGIGISIDETVTDEDYFDLVEIFSGKKIDAVRESNEFGIPKNLLRTSPALSHSLFKTYHSETEFLRYIKRLESKDLSLCQSMIPLGSCTMKLNATAEMIPVTWTEFGGIHPFAPKNQAQGYSELFDDLERSLADMTGFDSVSLQPNAGSQGEYAGLMAIRAYHHSKGSTQRNICLIPKSAHGTNPATAAMVGMQVVVVNCDTQGNIEVSDLKLKAEQYKDSLAALMITYPSTHGVFEVSIKEIAQIIHQNGGQVYLDGANLNALVGYCKPGELGADVCHINLHKTFCIPHGGGGPGMGPIAVAEHLAPHLPSHSVIDNGRKGSVTAVSGAPWGSASILPISWMYMAMMGTEGLQKATAIAIANANYIAKRLDQYFPVLYKGENGLVAHECILDLRALKATCGVEVEDVAKRLMDYSFHAPTVSFPVAGTMMVEPTESESKQELDRFCDAMIAIWNEAKAIEQGKLDKSNNPLKNAPHTLETVISDTWDKPYSREQAAYPVQSLRNYKFWPSVGRVDAAAGDRNLVCACLPIEEY